MPGKLSTHVLDTAHGKPAAGLRIRLLRGDAVLVDTLTNADGRTDAPLLLGSDLLSGPHTLHFFVADYFRSVKHSDAGKFLEVVRVDFVIDDGDKPYHVPLLVSPWSYSTYRGS